MQAANCRDELPPPHARPQGLNSPHRSGQANASEQAARRATGKRPELTNDLLRTGRYLAIHPECILTFPTRHPFIRKLPVQLPIISGPTGILTLKNRELNPAAQVFMECAREVAKPLRRRR